MLKAFMKTLKFFSVRRTGVNSTVPPAVACRRIEKQRAYSHRSYWESRIQVTFSRRAQLTKPSMTELSSRKIIYHAQRYVSKVWKIEKLQRYVRHGGKLQKKVHEKLCMNVRGDLDLKYWKASTFPVYVGPMGGYLWHAVELKEN